MNTKESLLSKKYTWGNLVNVYEIGCYLIAEYYPKKDYGNSSEQGYEETPSFQPYVNGSDTNHSFDTLDKALIHAVSCNAGHSRASEFIINMLSATY